jgi:hypothetical protein
MTDYCRLQWQRLTNDRPDLSSERESQKDKTVTLVEKKNLWSKVPAWARHQDILTDWPSVVMWLWLWFWLISSVLSPLVCNFSSSDVLPSSSSIHSYFLLRHNSAWNEVFTLLSRHFSPPTSAAVTREITQWSTSWGTRPAEGTQKYFT